MCFGKAVLPRSNHLNHSVLKANTMSGTNIFKISELLKRRTITIALSTALGIFNCLNLVAAANPVTYSAPSDNQGARFSGEVSVKQIGSLLLPKAVVQFNGTEVNVLAVPDWLFDRSVVLAGALVKAQIDIQGKNSNLRGLLYFIEGQWLGNLASINAIDVIDTISGERLRGNIKSRIDNAFAFKPETGPMRKLPFTEIKNINSPKAYIFTISSASSKVVPTDSSIEFDANTIAFAPTFGRAYIAKAAKLPKSTLSGAESGISNSEIGVLIGVNVATDLAPAIAIPLALNPGTRSQAQRQLNLYESEQQRAAGIPVPLNFSSNAP